MSAAEQLAPDEVLVDEDAPRITDAEREAFAAWCAAHPPPAGMDPDTHARWMQFQAHVLRAQYGTSASGGAPPATLTPTGRDPR